MRINFIAGLSCFLYQPVFFCQCKSLYCGLRCIGAQKIFKRDSRTKGMQRRRRLHRIRPFWYVNKQALLRPARGSSNCREGPAWQAGCMEAAWHPAKLDMQLHCVAIAALFSRNILAFRGWVSSYVGVIGRLQKISSWSKAKRCIQT